MSKRIELTSRVRHELMGDGDIRNAADITGDCLVRFDNGILVWCAEEALTIIALVPDTVMVEIPSRDAYFWAERSNVGAHATTQRLAKACQTALEKEQS